MDALLVRYRWNRYHERGRRGARHRRQYCIRKRPRGYPEAAPGGITGTLAS